MIQANELRIGNFILPNNGTINAFRVNAISYNDGRHTAIMYLDFPEKNQVLKLDLEDAKGIQLTEKYIVKAGFGEVGIYQNVYHKDNFRVTIGKGLCLFQIYEEDSVMGIEIKSVHQFQNLYFAITGKELEVEL